jgi:hypothetical protein
MTTSPETTQVSSGADSRTTAAQSTAPVPVVVQASAPVAAKAAGSRSASSPKDGKESAGYPVSARTSENFSPDVERSPAAAGKTALEIALAFAGMQTEESAPTGKVKTRETATEEQDEIDEEDIDTSGESDQETEVETDDEVDAESEEEAEASAEDEDEAESDAKAKADPLQGIVKAMQDKGLGKLAKRVTSVLAENGTLKAQLAQAAQKPIVQLAAPVVSEEQLLATAFTDDEVDAQAQMLQREGRKAMRWLTRNPEGGVWLEGQEGEMHLDAQAVERATEYWENALDGLSTAAQGRKTYLAKYAATVQELGVAPEEIVNPKVATRESKLIRAVPELTRSPDYLSLLADAAAGRELREKKAAGQVAIYVDAAKAKSTRTAAQKSQAVAADKSRATAAQASAPRAKASAGNATTLESLRTLAASGGPGSKAAQEKLALMAAGI